MATTVKNLGSALVGYSSHTFRPYGLKVTRAGRPDQAVFEKPGQMIFTTSREAMEKTGNNWGRGLPFARPAEELLWSNDCQAGSFLVDVRGAPGDPVTFVVSICDAADTDDTGADFDIDGVKIHVPGLRPNGNRLTFEVTTTKPTIRIAFDCGTDRRPDGIVFKFPCLKA